MDLIRKYFNFHKKKSVSLLPRKSKLKVEQTINTRNLKNRRYQKDDIQLRRGSYQISNVVGSSKDWGSKKKYWEKQSRLKFSQCGVEDCLNRATVGAHVWIREFPWRKIKPGIYIIPLCQVMIVLVSNNLGCKPHRICERESFFK